MPAEKAPIHAGHRTRMRSRFFETGLDGFQPHEILEMLLFCVIPKRDVNPLAHALLDEFGSVDAVLSASPEELARVSGVGRQTGEFFAALNAFAESYRSGCHLAPPNIGNLAAALRYVPETARNSLKYGVTVIFTDRYNRPLSVRFFPGRPSAPSVIRSILEKALSLHSHSVIIFCSGFRSPHPLGQQDLASFRPLIAALAAIDTFTVDCVLLTPTHLFSLRGENLLTGTVTDLQSHLSNWNYWLGPIASDQSETHWHPLSLLNEISPIR